MHCILKKISKMVTIPALLLLTSQSYAMNTAQVEAERKAAEIKAVLADPGLKAGNKAPNFALTNAAGKTIELNKALESGPVVLIFYRGAWCPYCSIHLHDLKKNMPEFEKYGAQIIAITPQKPDKSAEQVKKEGFPFEILSDSTYDVLKDYRLYFELSDDTVKRYKSKGLDLDEFNGKGRVGLPTPGAFIIDKSGMIRAMQAEVDYKSRMSPEAIIAELKKL